MRTPISWDTLKSVEIIEFSSYKKKESNKRNEDQLNKLKEQVRK